MKQSSLKPTTAIKSDHLLKQNEALEALKEMYRKNREEQKKEFKEKLFINFK